MNDRQSELPLQPFIEFHPTGDDFDGHVPFVPGARDREWFQPGFHHCLPLKIANQLGWTLLCPADFGVFWSGKDAADSLKVHGPSQDVLSHFGYGIFSYVPRFILKTSPGVDLLAKAVPNEPKDGVCVLEGLVETDNLNGRFSFNFRITRPNCWITFKKGDPFAHILPVPRDWLGSFNVRTIADGPEHERLIETAHHLENVRRDLVRTVDDPIQQRDRLYLRGRNPDGTSYKGHVRSITIPRFPSLEVSHLVEEEKPLHSVSESAISAHTTNVRQVSSDVPSIDPNKSYATFPDFFAEARSMRTAYVNHFNAPHEHRAETHQVWNYWHAPPLYTYLRTAPEKVLPSGVLPAFTRHLLRWSIRTLGLSDVGQPWLALYVNGFRQGLHNDVGNGRLAYVFSLTEWDGRRFEGGETLIFPPHAYWNSVRAQAPSAGTALYDTVEPRFNQLLVLDDRLVHGVQTVIGTNDPREGRIVLTGHLREGPIVVEGPVDHSAVAAAIGALRPELEQDLVRRYGSLAGLLTMRLDIASDGRVEKVAPLLELFEQLSNEQTDSPPEYIAKLLHSHRFGTTSGPTTIYLPLRFVPSRL